MKLRFNHNSELFFPDFGLFKPNWEGEIKYESIAKDMLNTGYFDKVIEKKKYKYVRFLDGQKFRDGTSLMKRFRELDFLVGYLEKPLFNYRIHDKSITHGKYSPEEIESLDEVINADNK